MKQKLTALLSVIFILTACNSNSAQSSVPEQMTLTGNLPLNSFYKKFIGSIGSISIVMDLTQKDSTLFGSYYYTKIGTPLTLYGHISPDGTFSLSETNDKYEETGTFTGSFLSDKTISGTWTNYKTKKSLPFNLSETTDNIVSVLFENRHSENCKNAERNKKQFSEDANTWDTLCTTIDLELIKISTSSSQTTQKINEEITRLVYSADYGEIKHSSIDELMNSVNSITDDEGYELSISCDLITNDNNILCICISQTYYGFGGAHPSSINNYYNFDIQTGKQILLDDFLLPNYRTTLNQIAEKKFIKTNGSDNWEFEKGDFKVNSNFAIRPDGLLFLYNQYEIGSYVMGAPTVFVSYKDINHLIKQNGPLEIWKKR